MPLLRIRNKILHFVHIPKTGGTSIELWASSLGSVGHFTTTKGEFPCTAQHFHAEIYDKMHLHHIADWSFAITRDPLDRLLSEFKMLVLRKHNPRAGVTTDTSELYDGHEENFDAWVQHIFKRYKRNPYVCDNHIRPQHEFLTPKTRTFRFEKGLEAVTTRIAFACDIEDAPDAPHKHKAEAHEVSASRETVRRIVEFYDRDYEELQYRRPADDALGGAETAETPGFFARFGWPLRKAA